ncbi:MAG: tRNA 2-thiouridine(34) synthase MnmA [Rickettsiales bacterium]
MTQKMKIVVAMSGGVDSSTVAAMLASQGHEVIGVTLQLYDHGVSLGKKGACCAGLDIYDAQMAAEKIGIPHYVLNYESIFKQSVMDDFADSYLRGETPIPCVKCNQSVKFRDLFKVAKDLGADKLATGHYVQKIIVEGKPELHQGIDSNKDQSYFLFATTKEQLDFLLFPLGGLTKDKTRELARSYGLEIADKPDSQDICFVPNGNYAAIVEKLRPGALDKGNFVDVTGKVLGTHEGIINFTVGQRRGIGIASSEPLYVIKINPETKEVVVGGKEHLFSAALKLRDLNWLGHVAIPEEGLECKVKLRSAHSGQIATIYNNQNEILVKLAEDYQGITPGQACVIYDNTRVLGGGWIVRN